MPQTNFHVTGYNPYEWFFATRFKQGGRTVYSIEFSVREIITFVPKPDPTKPVDVGAAQRKIHVAHARSFADYILDEEEWVSPALLLRGPSIFEWAAADLGIDTGTTQFGQLGVPKDSRGEIQIVDGQHRTLGFHLAWERLNADIEKARTALDVAKAAGQPIVINDAAFELERLKDKRAKIAGERVAVQIFVIENVKDARRVFVDINDNAKGVTGAVRARFDDRKVVNRALNLVLQENPFLDGLVDLEQDRATGNSPYLLGAKHVADILRALTVGNGRIGKAQEAIFEEKVIASEFDEFVDGLVEGFPPLASLEAGDLSAPDLRVESLIGSNVMWRAFAAAWFELKSSGWSAEKIQKSFSSFAPHMGPVFEDPADTWFQTKVFQPAEGKPTTSPTSRAQDFKTLTSFIVESCKNVAQVVPGDEGCLTRLRWVSRFVRGTRRLLARMTRTFLRVESNR